MTRDSHLPQTGADVANIVFDTYAGGNADIMTGMTTWQVPHLKEALSQAAERITHVAVELGMNEEQTMALFQIYSLGACTTTLVLSIDNKQQPQAL